MAFLASLLPALGSIASSILPGVGRVVGGALSGGIKSLEDEFKPAQAERKQVKKEEEEEDEDLEEEEQIRKKVIKGKGKAINKRVTINKRIPVNYRTIQKNPRLTQAQLNKMMYNKRAKHY